MICRKFENRDLKLNLTVIFTNILAFMFLFICECVCVHIIKQFGSLKMTTYVN